MTFTLSLLLGIATATAPAPLPTAARPVEQLTAEQSSHAQQVQAARSALEAGDFVGAKAIVDRLVIADRMAATLALLGSGQPMEAMAAADEALQVESLQRADRAAVLLARGRAAFDAAGMDPKYSSLYEEALANFEDAARTGAGVSAAFRASRAARMVGDHETALKLARAGARWVQGGAGRAAGLALDQGYTRTLAEAAFSSYLAAPKATDEDKAARAALFTETQGALEHTIGLTPTNTWAYQQLSNLNLWEGRRAESLQALEAALSVQPADEALHTAFVKALGDNAEAVAREAGADDSAALTARFDGIISRYEAFRALHPENALGYWYGGFEQFYEALNAFEQADREAERFEEAEALFRRCRELNPGYSGACIDFEVLCRNGAGWCAYHAGENEAAITGFMATDELRTLEAAAESGRVAGLEVRLPRGDGSDRMPSSLAGLDFVTRRFIADPMDIEALTRAAAIGDMMFAKRPQHPNLANNAGFLNRDAAVLWEGRAAAMFAAAEAAETADDKAVATSAAQAARGQGQELMERSWAAYQVAAALLSDDVRVVNDAGLIMTYYLRTDADAAEVYLLDAVQDGGPQLADTDMDEAVREALVEAWGDAHQNMGILEMTLRGRPAEAKAWFEKALEIGPPSRNWLKSVLPILDTWSETGKRPDDIDTIEARTVWAHNPPQR